MFSTDGVALLVGSVLWVAGSFVLLARGLLQLRALRQDRRDMPDAHLGEPLKQAIGSLVFGAMGVLAAATVRIWLLARVLPRP